MRLTKLHRKKSETKSKRAWTPDCPYPREVGETALG